MASETECFRARMEPTQRMEPETMADTKAATTAAKISSRFSAAALFMSSAVITVIWEVSGPSSITAAGGSFCAVGAFSELPEDGDIVSVWAEDCA